MRHIIAALLVLAMPGLALAGRPLGTDDAGTAGHKQCQFESWGEHAEGAHGWVVSPACGFGEFELGLEVSRTRVSGGAERGQALALKWVPEWAKAGPLNFGLKLSRGRADVGAGWFNADTTAFGIVTWEIDDAFTLHGNLGIVRDHNADQNNAMGNLAVVWTPHDKFFVFAEVMGQRRSSTTQGVGARYWLIDEKLGLDLTVSRQAGVPDSTTYTFGLGWYGIFGK